MLASLRSEAIGLLRQAAFHFRKPVILFSGGKDSIALVELAKLAFSPGKIPFALLHIDTGHNFPEALQFRDEFAHKMDVELLVYEVEESLRRNAELNDDPKSGRNRLQSVSLKEASARWKIDALIGGGRRDEEKARAKERLFSLRREDGAWKPERQRPEPWGMVNPFLAADEQMRIFPLSNWTELDVWKFIEADEIALPSLYYAHDRSVRIKSDGMILANAHCVWNDPDDRVETLRVRCRTVGDMTCTGLMQSSAANPSQVVEELAGLRISERGGRQDDRHSESAMEDRKREGYF